MTDHLVAPEHDRDVWLDWRRGGLGGSDVAAIAGLSPFATPMTVWLDKTGQLPADPPSAAMRWGQRLEQVVADAFCEETGVHVICPQTRVVDPNHPHRRVTLDGFTAPTPDSTPADADGVAELKTTSNAPWDVVPDHIMLQVQYQLAVSGFDQATVVALHASRGFHLATHRVAAERPLIVELLALVDEFWDRHVLGGEPPAVDGTTATTDAIRAAWPDSQPGVIVERPDLTDVWSSLCAAKGTLKAAQERVAELENTLKAALGDAETLIVNGGQVAATWKVSTQSRVDTTALRSAHPELVAEFTRTSTVRRFLAKEPSRKEPTP